MTLNGVISLILRFSRNSIALQAIISQWLKIRLLLLLLLLLYVKSKGGMARGPALAQGHPEPEISVFV